MKDFSKEIEAYAVRNALEYGEVQQKSILPKLFQHGLEKKDIKEIMPKIIEIVKDVNSRKKESLEKDFDKLEKYLPEKVEKEEGLSELQGVVKKPVFRVAPFPSGALHIGNAKTFLINALYAEKYGGKVLLMFDDTIGSEAKPIDEDAYDLIKDAFKWLGIKYDKKVYYKSDRLETYYEYGEKLIDMGEAYVCECSREELRKNREEGVECNCRKNNVKKTKEKWKEMFKMNEGEAVLRLKTDMKHPNPAFRDRVLFKIADREHPRVGNKYRVWPTLEMSWSIDDYLLGITHIIRGNDLMIETEMEKYIWDLFGWKAPIIIHTGLINIKGVEGAKISKSKARNEVKSGEFSGWDDPRTWSIQSLRRRGILPEAVKTFVENIGLNKQDITVPIKTLYSLNRKIIDPDALRYSFVEDPIKLKITGAPDVKNVKVPVHPDKDEKREVSVGEDIHISKDDSNNLNGKELRLLHLYNLKLNKNGKEGKYSGEEIGDMAKINWVGEGVKTKILMPNGKWVGGIADEGISKLYQDQIIQFERFGFCRFDCKNKNEVYEFWFAHK